MSLPENALALLQQGVWFRSIPAELRRFLLSAGSTVDLESGSQLFARGDESKGFYAVLEGSIRITGSDQRGREAILVFIDVPNWFGEIALFDGNTRTHDAYAEGSVRLLHVGTEELLEYLGQNPGYWREFGLLMASKLRQSFSMMEDSVLLPANVRMARRLAAIAGNYGELADRSKRVLVLHQEQLGRLLGISRQTCNRILKELEGRKLIMVSYGRIELLDLDGLRQFDPQKE